MSNRIRPARSIITGVVPPAGAAVDFGRIAVSIPDQKLWMYDATGTPQIVTTYIGDHDASRSYVAGDLAVESGTLYRCDTPIGPKAFDPDDWSAVGGGGSLATVATTGDYDDLLNKPTLGTAAAANTGDFATAAQGSLAATALQPGVQIPWGDVTSKPTFATVATTGAYSDLGGIPSTFTPSAHTHTLTDITDSGDMAAYAEATAAQVRGFSTSDLGVTTRRLRDAVALITPAGGSNWTPDWSAFVSADWNVTSNRTLNNPTNVIPGTTRLVKIRASTSTERTISLGSNYKGNIPTATVTNAKFLLVSLTAISSTEIVVSYLEYEP